MEGRGERQGVCDSGAREWIFQTTPIKFAMSPESAGGRRRGATAVHNSDTRTLFWRLFHTNRLTFLLIFPWALAKVDHQNIYAFVDYPFDLICYRSNKKHSHSDQQTITSIQITHIQPQMFSSTLMGYILYCPHTMWGFPPHKKFQWLAFVLLACRCISNTAQYLVARSYLLSSKAK